jgi:hypothetical protein
VTHKDIRALFDAESDPLEDCPTPQTKRTEPYRRTEDRDGDRFIGCPVWWFKAALAVVKGEKEFAVAIYLWRLRTLHRSKTVDVTNAGLRKLGVDRQAKYRATRRLAKAKLISVKRRGFAALRVTFLR